MKFLIEMDYQDTRKRYVVSEDFLDDVEFEMFDGRVIEESNDPISHRRNPGGLDHGNA